MSRRQVRIGRMSLAVVVLAGFAVGSLPAPSVTAEETAERTGDPWSGLMDAKQLESVIQTQVESLDDQLRSRGKFRRGYKKAERVGITIAVLGNLGVATLEGEASGKAATLRDAGLELAEAAGSKDYEASKAAADRMADFPEKTVPGADPQLLEWSEVVDLHDLMELVGSIDAALKRAVASSSAVAFRKATREQEPMARVLAVLGTIARDARTESDWRQWCDDLRTESLAVADEMSGRRQSGAKEAYERMQASCTHCHEVYQEEPF